MFLKLIIMQWLLFRFEGEIENYSCMENVLAKLDMKTIKLSGFTELLKVRAAEAKTPFPTR